MLNDVKILALKRTKILKSAIISWTFAAFLLYESCSMTNRGFKLEFFFASFEFRALSHFSAKTSLCCLFRNSVSQRTKKWIFVKNGHLRRKGLILPHLNPFLSKNVTLLFGENFWRAKDKKEWIFVKNGHLRRRVNWRNLCADVSGISCCAQMSSTRSRKICR